jgi:hypothetical protein
MLADELKMHGFEECAEDYQNWSKQISDYDTEDDKLEWKKAEENSQVQPPYLFLPDDYFIVKD